MDILKFKDELFAKALEGGFSDCEIHYVNGYSFEVSVFQNEVCDYQVKLPEALSFRGSIDGKMGYAYTEHIEGSIDFLITQAKDNAILKEDYTEKLYKGSKEYNLQSSNYSSDIGKISPNKKIEIAKLMEQAALNMDDVKTVDHCTIIEGYTQTSLYNSYGLSLTDKASHGVLFISVLAEKNGEIKRGLEIELEKDLEGLDEKKLAKKAVEKATAQFGANVLKSGEYNILLTNEASVELLEVFSPCFFGENVDKGLSLLKDKVDTVIANENVTIADDVSNSKALYNIVFDSEGVCTKNKIIVDKGVLKGYLHNLKSATKAGVEPTGNGFKSSVATPIGTSVVNFYIKPSNITEAELLKQLNNGIMISAFSGLHAGANNITGDFSLLAEGFLVKDGKKDAPVFQFTMAGNYFELLKNVEAVGDDLYFNKQGQSIGSPSMLVKNVKIAGDD